MRRKILAWSAVVLLSTVLAPPAVGIAELADPDNVRIIGGLRTETTVRYDLTVMDGPLGAFHVADYYQLRIGDTEVTRLLDGTERPLVHVEELQSLSAVPSTRPVFDRVHERWIDPETDKVVMYAKQGNDAFEHGLEWRIENTSRLSMSPIAEATPFDFIQGDMILFHAPIRADVADFLLDKTGADRTVKRAYAAGFLDGRPVLGHLADAERCQPWVAGFSLSESYLGRKAPAVTVAWYDRDSVFPLRIDCITQDGTGAPFLMLHRTQLSEGGAALHANRALRDAQEGAPDSEPFHIIPPNGDFVPYSLHEAHRAVVADESLTEFTAFRQESDMFVLKRANLQVAEPTNPGVSHIAGRDPRTAVLPVDTYAYKWSLTYLNDAGTEITVYTERTAPEDSPSLNRDGKSEASVVPLKPGFDTLADLRLVPVSAAVTDTLASVDAFDLGLYDMVTFDLRIGVLGGITETMPEYTLYGYTKDAHAWRTFDAVSGRMVTAAETEYTYQPMDAQPASAEPGESIAVTARPLADVAVVTASAGLLTLLAALFTPGHGILAPFYAKIARHRVLEHPRRAELYDRLRAAPGASAKEIQTALGIGWGTVMHHVGVLERNHFIVSRRSGRHRRYWCTADRTADEVRREATLAEETPRRILHALTANPGISQAEIARRLGLARSTVHHHTNRLKEAGLVSKTAKRTP